MPNITKINSSKGLVTFSKEDLADLDLLKWVKADSLGITNRYFISVQPIEKAAAKVYNEKFPTTQIKLAEKCFARTDGGVDVVLRVAQEVSEGNYKKHPTKLTFSGEARAKEKSTESTISHPTFNESTLEEEDRKEASGLSLSIDFIEQNIDKLSDDEKRQIFSELGNDSADAFLRDLKMAMLDSVSVENLPKDLDFIEETEETEETEENFS